MRRMIVCVSLYLLYRLLLGDFALERVLFFFFFFFISDTRCASDGHVVPEFSAEGEGFHRHVYRIAIIATAYSIYSFRLLRARTEQR